MNIAVIPARGGSQRIPGKNSKLFAGKPMIEYSIHAARQSGAFDHIIVSTDNRDIAAIAVQAGAEVPFMRPSALGENHVNVADVVCHAIAESERHYQQAVRYACCVVATAPFLKPEFLCEGFSLIQAKLADSVVSVAAYAFPVFRAFKKNQDGSVSFQWPEYELTHSQDLPQMYHDAAQFYWLNVVRFMESKSLMGRNVMPVMIPEYLVCDIDTPEDWQRAELLYQACKEKGLL